MRTERDPVWVGSCFEDQQPTKATTTVPYHGSLLYYYYFYRQYACYRFSPVFLPSWETSQKERRKVQVTSLEQRFQEVVCTRSNNHCSRIRDLVHPSSMSVTKLKVSTDGESAGSFDIVGRKLNRGGTGERFHGLERTDGTRWMSRHNRRAWRSVSLATKERNSTTMTTVHLKESSLSLSQLWNSSRRRKLLILWLMLRPKEKGRTFENDHGQGPVHGSEIVRPFVLETIFNIIAPFLFLGTCISLCHRVTPELLWITRNRNNDRYDVFKGDSWFFGCGQTRLDLLEKWEL